jgi:hypothetical protein
MVPAVPEDAAGLEWFNPFPTLGWLPNGGEVREALCRRAFLSPYASAGAMVSQPSTFTQTLLF